MDATRETTLVLGGSGFLGAHALAVLAAGRCGSDTGRVISASRRPAAGAPPPAGVELHCVDGERPGAARALCDLVRPERVLCVAALARAADCEADPARARAANAALPEELARWCALRGARLVSVSTDLVFGGEPAPAGGFTEDDPPAPVSAYGRSKAEGEERVLAAHPSALVVRLPLLYGSSAGRGLGASDALLAAVAQGERPRLFTDEWRTPLEVANAARALVELLAGEAAGRLHVAGPDRLSRFELGQAVLRAAGHAEAAARELAPPARQAEVEAAAPRPADVSLDASRARRLLATELLGVRDALTAAAVLPPGRRSP